VEPRRTAADKSLLDSKAPTKKEKKQQHEGQNVQDVIFIFRFFFSPRFKGLIFSFPCVWTGISTGFAAVEVSGSP